MLRANRSRSGLGRGTERDLQSGGSEFRLGHRDGSDSRDEQNPRSSLTYYKEFAVDLLKLLAPRPDILLLHDWPIAPARIEKVPGRRPELENVGAIQPAFVCCGHHQTSAAFVVGNTHVRALNIIGGKSYSINPGWACVFEWDGSGLQNERFLPPIR